MLYLLRNHYIILLKSDLVVKAANPKRGAEEEEVVEEVVNLFLNIKIILQIHKKTGHRYQILWFYQLLK